MLIEAKPLRYTPAGIPVIDVVVRHESEQAQFIGDTGTNRNVQLQMNAQAFGPLALRLSRTALGSPLQMRGFLVGSMSKGKQTGKQTMLHLQDCDWRDVPTIS